MNVQKNTGPQHRGAVCVLERIGSKRQPSKQSEEPEGFHDDSRKNRRFTHGTILLGFQKKRKPSLALHLFFLINSLPFI
ncbi:hypothetical protein SKAU_G00318280 [Synaphobranchus kaupii]|uniref:Uncharacterized protein n=1 Tax=Synaphobranchus kaupii TaxID=118154 RepID=A0A9Q1IJU3_SYNKA|nr:hypothetical protein SKAU_G00318280 [Synaphobranchus kaupii]